MADINPQTGAPIDLRKQQGASGAAAGTSGAKASGSAAAGTSVFAKFEIPETVKKQYPDLIPLILATESMTDDERQYWFQILPIMTEEQVAKLREILANEKKQLQKLDRDYEDEIKRINAKHVTEWKTFEAKEKREKLKAAEGAHEKTEKEQEEEMLKKLQGL